MIRGALRIHLKKLLIFLFAALGPIGNLLTPSFFPKSFRIYYFLLPLFPFFFFPHFNQRLAKFAMFFFPLFCYAFFSSLCVEKIGEANEPHTLFRFFLLFCQYLFIIGAASSLKEEKDLIKTLRIYLQFFFVSVLAGYFLFFGYYLNVFSFDFVMRFSILAQEGFGILRFSPGSYPNEYGIISSFALGIFALIFLEKKEAVFDFSRKTLKAFLILTFFAFLLTTTRAAYLSFFVTMIYIAWQTKHFLKAATVFLGLILAGFSTLFVFNINMFEILSHGFSQKITEGSLGERYTMWIETLEKAKEHPFWGAGFASLTNIHNVYLQLLFELGFVGMVLLLGAFLLSWIEGYAIYKTPRMNETLSFWRKVRVIGFINVLSFAASNHNLNHHLTWFVCFLALTTLRIPSLIPLKKEPYTAL